MNKSVAVLLFVLTVTSVMAQDLPVDSGPKAQTPADTKDPLILAPYRAATDFFNFFAFANGVIDSNGYLASSTSHSASFGYDLGGGVSANHQFSRGNLSLNYTGDYRAYTSSNYPSGTNQNLSVLFKRRLGKRWGVTLGEQAGILFQGGVYFPQNPTEIGSVQTNPFTSSTKFEGTLGSLTYQQTRRLSYDFTGSFFIQRYGSNQSIGTTNGSGTASVIYQLTRRTSLSGTYQHSTFGYQHGGGSTNADSGYLTVSHILPDHWTVGASGGITRSSSSGVVQIPVPVQLGQQIVTVIVLGPYHTTALLPYYQGSLGHQWKHSVFSLAGGQSVTPGNGIFLASRTLSLNGNFSYSQRRSNISVGGFYSRLYSLANPVSTGFSSSGIVGTYSETIRRHLGLNATYEFVGYGGLGTYGGRNDSRLMFGIYFTSKDFPLHRF